MNEVQIKGTKWFIDNEERILLCASLFYFRIPKEVWADRMQKIKAMGYNTIDVYFPWNYHEKIEGKWNFGDNRDIETFLQLAQEHNLYVIARPGPYICSEWDMGGLPSYLLTKQVELRQNDPQYLLYVEKWFAQVLPILKRYQYTETGTIISLQIENELDFYHCKDVIGYMSALKAIVDSYHFNIPIIACAGQGDVMGGTGYVEGIIPALNLYPGVYNQDFAYSVDYVLNLSKKLNIPLLVTETNRDATMLRMLLGVGASLIAPYNQVGGTNYEYYNGINNWVRPNAFMTSDYDFDSLIKPNGEYGSGEKEARIFRGIYEVFERLLAKGTVTKQDENQARYVHYVNEVDGFKFHTLLNPTETDLTIDGLLIPAHRIQYVIENFSLRGYHIQGAIKFSTAEIIGIKQNDQKLIIQTFTRNASKLELILDGIHIKLQLNQEKSSQTFGDVIIENVGLDSIDETPKNKFTEIQTVEICQVKSVATTQVSMQESLYLEEAGIYYGMAEYTVQLNDEIGPITHLLLENPGDILSIYQENDYLGTIANGGFTTCFPVKGKGRNFTIHAEIWGHSNFDDSIAPNTLIASKKGLKQLVAVTNYQDISGQWLLVDLAGEVREDLLQPLGHYLRVADEFMATYHKIISVVEGKKIWLQLEKPEQVVSIQVNESVPIEVMMSEFIDISPWITGHTVKLIITIKKPHHSVRAGRIELIHGIPVTNITLNQVILENGVTVQPKEEGILPIPLIGGQDYIITVPVLDAQPEQMINLCIEGENVIVTAYDEHQVYSRLFFSTKDDHSKMSGGNPHLMYLPGTLIKNNGIKLYVRAINEIGTIQTLGYQVLSCGNNSKDD